MTYIHPDKNKSILNYILAGLIFFTLGGIFLLVTLYNNVVNLDHNIATMKSQVDSIGAENTTLNNQVVATLGGGGLQDIATENGLVVDNHPQYFPTNQSWPIASQQ